MLCSLCQAAVSRIHSLYTYLADNNVYQSHSSVTHRLIPSLHIMSHRMSTTYSITRAFLIEEATIVKRVLKAKAAATKK